ncbi:MAG: extracellular substrate binding-like orphan protein GrrP [Limnoraphis sp.]
MFPKFLIAFLGILVALSFPTTAKAETVVEKAARTGIITMGGRSDVIPYSYINDKKELVGYSLDVASLIEQEVSLYLGKPVEVQFQTINELSEVIPKTANGEIDLACNTQFTWQREMFVDYSMPYSLSGIRLLIKKGSLTGTPESLVGKRIAVLPNSLGESTLKSFQPKAVLVTVAGIDQGIADLVSGKVDAIAGDSVVLAGNIQRVSETDYQLVPSAPYVRYAVGCMMPENNSTFRNLVNLAIAKMLQGYVIGETKYTDMVNKWLGPVGILEIPTEIIKDYFQTVLLNYEQIPIPDSSTTKR